MITRLLAMFASQISWACSMGKHELCDGTADGPGTGNCQCRACVHQ